MKVTILTGNEELGDALSRYLFFVISGNIIILRAKLGHPETVDIDMKNSDLWLTEAVNPEDISNPEGFRTAKLYAGLSHSLVLFIGINSEIPLEGNFWFKLPAKKLLSQKLKEVMKNSPPRIEEFEALEKQANWLTFKPSHHHHYG